MERHFYTYALAQALSEAGQDYVDTFVPFFLAAVRDDRESTLRDVQTSLTEKFSLDIPEAVLSTIGTRAKRRDFVTQEAQRFRLTDKGRSYRASLEGEAEVSRRINALLDDFRQFAATSGNGISREEAELLLSSFLSSSVEPLMEFMRGSDAGALARPVATATEQERLLADYICEAEESKTAQFETLRQIVLGSLLTTVLQARDSEEVINLRRRRMRDLVVYLDTNFLFSVLQLHSSDFAEPALQLFGMFKTCGLTPKVFSFTVDEACRVLTGYLTGAHRYPSSVRVDTFYSTLRTRGWTQFQVREYIANIEEVLEEAGIDVETALVDVRNYQASATDRGLLERFKPDQPTLGQNHDLAAIARVRQVRGGTVRKFEDSKAFFLTSDIRLSRYCHRELGHADHGTVAEVMLDKLLTNILWLKDPRIDAPIRMLIGAYSRDLFVKRSIWDRFYDVLTQLRRDGKVSDDRVAGLFYRNYVEDVLIEFDAGDTKRISQDFVLQQIENAAAQRDEAELEKLKKQEQEFIKHLGTALDETQAASDKQWAERLESIRSSIRLSVESSGKRLARWVASVCTLVMLAAAGGVYLLARSQGWGDFLAFFLPLLVGGGSIVALWKVLYNGVRNRYVHRIYPKRLSEARLLDEASTGGEPSRVQSQG